MTQPTTIRLRAAAAAVLEMLPEGPDRYELAVALEEAGEPVMRCRICGGLVDLLDAVKPDAFVGPGGGTGRGR